MSGTDPIDAYLAALRRRLAEAPVDGERVVQEVEDHLRDLQDELIAGGSDPVAAAHGAIARFGGPEAVAAGFGAVPDGRPAMRSTLGGWAVVAAIVVGVGALFEVAVVGASPWIRLLVGMVGLAVLERSLLSRGAGAVVDGLAGRGPVLAFALGAVACTVGGIVRSGVASDGGGAAWFGTAAAAALAAAFLGALPRLASS